VIKLKVPAQLELRGRESLEQRDIPLMFDDSTQSHSRTVDLPTTKTEKRFARIPFSEESTSLKPCVFKTFAAICGLTFEEKINGTRFTRGTNIELGRQAHCHPKRIGEGLVELERAGLVSVQSQGRTRTITLSTEQTSCKVFSSIDLSDHAWKQHARAFKVYAGLKKFKGLNHEAFMTNPTLARLLSMCVSSVKRGFMELNDAGLIQSLIRWDGKRRSRRVVFPVQRPCLKTLTKHEGQNSPLEDRAPEHEGQNSPLEDSKSNRTHLVEHEGQNSPLVRDKTAPLYGTKQPLGEGQNSPLETNLKRTLNKPIHTQPSQAVVQGAEFDGLASVCVGSVHSQAQQASQSDLETMLERLRGLIETQFPLKLDQIEVRKVVSALWAKHGPIPAEFIADGFQSGIDPNTVQRVGIAKRNLNSWKSLSEPDRAIFGDEIKIHDKQLNRTVSKYNGAERVKRLDGSWCDKALPAENGSGIDANEHQARRDGYTPIEEEQRIRLNKVNNSLPPEAREQIEKTGFARKINGKTWVKVAQAESIITQCESGIPITEPEPEPVYCPVKKNDGTQGHELKELAIKINDSALAMWDQYKKETRKAIVARTLKTPSLTKEGAKKDTELTLSKETKIEEFKTLLRAKHEPERLAILAKCQTRQSEELDHEHAMIV